MLDVTDLCKFYQGPNGTVRALDSVSLHVTTGEFVAVQGSSGCGKTTLLLAAGGLLEPDEGKVAIKDQNPYHLSPDGRARFRAASIGFVFQQFYLVSYLTIMDNVLAPSLALANPYARKRAGELIERFNLAHRTDHIPSELSTGERQRAALARALLNSPGLLLADEPTGNLDKDNADVVLSYFVEFAATGGSVLMVTHSETAAGYAHRTLHLKDGKII
jgi:putative ABC transport system ATP-binding protein